MGTTEERPFCVAFGFGLAMVGAAYLLNWVWFPSVWTTGGLGLIAVSVVTCIVNYANEYKQLYQLQYSKFAPEGTVPARLGWFLMYFIPMMFYVALWLYSGKPSSRYDLFILSLYCVHFTKRCLECLVVHKYSKDCCLQTVVEVASFYSLGAAATFYSAHILPGDERMGFIKDKNRIYFGVGIYVFGQLCNLYHHMLLAGLRKPGQYGYVVPKGGLFGFIVCPQYFGELISWFGFAVAGYNFGLYASGFIPMVVYLSGRAHHTHAWYKNKFEDYPGKGMRKIWPFVY